MFPEFIVPVLYIVIMDGIKNYTSYKFTSLYNKEFVMPEYSHK